MKSTIPILSCTFVLFFVAVAFAFSQFLPVSKNLWRLMAQEETAGEGLHGMTFRGSVKTQ